MVLMLTVVSGIGGMEDTESHVREHPNDLVDLCFTFRAAKALFLATSLLEAGIVPG